MSKTVKEYFETLVSLCVEALELYPADKIKPVQVRDNIKATETIFQKNVEWDKTYLEYKDILLAGERQWFLENEFKVSDLDIGYCIAFAEKEDTDLSTAIIYYLYQSIISSGIVSDEQERVRLTEISKVLKSIVNNSDTSTIGPSAAEFKSFGEGMPNITNILSTFMPAMQNMMQSNELKEFMKVATPSNINPSQPPDISQIINNTMGALNTTEGKNFFNKLTVDFAGLAGNKK